MGFQEQQNLKKKVETHFEDKKKKKKVEHSPAMLQHCVLRETRKAALFFPLLKEVQQGKPSKKKSKEVPFFFFSLFAVFRASSDYSFFFFSFSLSFLFCFFVLFLLLCVHCDTFFFFLPPPLSLTLAQLAPAPPLQEPRHRLR